MVMNEMSFSTMLKSERTKRGWTRIKLYMKVNALSTKDEQIVSIESIASWENGKRLPRLEATLALARVYQKPELISLRIQAVDFMREEVS